MCFHTPPQILYRVCWCRMKVSLLHMVYARVMWQQCNAAYGYALSITREINSAMSRVMLARRACLKILPLRSQPPS